MSRRTIAAGDTDDLEVFIKALNNYVNHSSVDMMKLKKAYSKLRNSWKDSQAEKFEDSFKEHDKHMKKILLTYKDELLPDLKRKYKKLKEYTDLV